MKRSSKAELIALICKVAAEHGGYVGMQRFSSLTGLSKDVWRYYWPKFSAFQIEAGLPTSELQVRLDDNILLDALVPLVRSLGRMPTRAEWQIFARENRGAPVHSTFFRAFGTWANAAQSLKDYCLAHPKYQELAPLITPRAPSAAKAATVPRKGAGYVYLAQHGTRKEYKIGKEDHWGGRAGPVSLQTPLGTQRLHQIETDSPLGVEQWWKRYFAKKHLNGEWFALDAEDIRFFKRQREMYLADLVKL